MYFVEGLNTRLGSPGFAGTLGENSLSAHAREFLDRVRRNPADVRKLLLMVIFHPDPASSMTAIRVNMKGFERGFVLLDQILILGVGDPGIFFDELRRIAADFQKRDTSFNRQVDTELQLRGELFATAGEQARRLPPQTLKPFLVEALLMGNLSYYYFTLGVKAKAILPPVLADRIAKSEVPEAHYVHMGRWLRRYGEVLQTKDAAFKALVEKERMSKQLKHEQENAQQKRKRP